VTLGNIIKFGHMKFAKQTPKGDHKANLTSQNKKLYWQ